MIIFRFLAYHGGWTNSAFKHLSWKKISLLLFGQLNRISNGFLIPLPSPFNLG